MAETLKIVIPMAGWGTRMRPHTWSKPKPLIAVAGRTALDYLLDMFKTVPDPTATKPPPPARPGGETFGSQ